MALTLALDIEERNDSELITFTDTTTNWNVGGNINFTSIQARTSQTYSLTLDITINTPTSVIIYDTIDLYVLHGGAFSVQTDLVFPINATNLTVSSVPLGDANTLLPDGIWDIVYKVQHYSGGVWSDVANLPLYILVDGQVKNQVYNKLMQVPKIYSNLGPSRDIQEAQLYYTFLQAIEKSAYVAKKVELIDMLETLQRLLLNGSNYPW